MLEPSAAGDDDAGAQASQAAPGGELVLELAPGAPQLAVQIASDLHIEFAERFVPAHPDDAALQSIVTPSAPVLALLGDIGIPTYPVYRRFLLLQAERFEHVLVISTTIPNRTGCRHQPASPARASQSSACSRARKPASKTCASPSRRSVPSTHACTTSTIVWCGSGPELGRRHYCAARSGPQSHRKPWSQFTAC